MPTPQQLDLGSIKGPAGADAFHTWCSKQYPTALDPEDGASWTAYLSAIKGEPGEPGADGLTQGQVDARVVAGITGKMDTIAVDASPTASSTNLVTSGGVKTALDGKQASLTIATVVEAANTNPVTSGAVKTALDTIGLIDTGWIPMTLTDKASGNISYRVRHGVLYLVGTVVVSDMSTTTLTADAIPVQYRPSSSYAMVRINAENNIWRHADMYMVNGKVVKGGVADYKTDSAHPSGVSISLALTNNSWVI